MKRLTALALVLALAACKQDQPAPSQKIAKAADELIAKASGAPPAIKLGKGAYAPRDECADVPGAAEFRQQLTKVVGDRDMENGTVSPRHRADGDLGAMSMDAFAALLKQVVDNKEKK